MRHFIAIHTIARANYGSWIKTKRTVVMLVSIVLLCLLETIRQNTMLPFQDQSLHISEYVYLLLSSNFSIVMSSTIFFVMISDLMSKNNFHQAEMIRSSRGIWLSSQVLYCLWTTLSMIALCCMFLGLFSLFFSSAIPGWTYAANDLSMDHTEYDLYFPVELRSTFSPIGSIAYALLPTFLFWFTMTMVILAFSLWGHPSIGLLVCAFVIVSSYIGNYNFLHPITYAYAEGINPGFQSIERYHHTMIGYFVVNCILLISMAESIHKTEL